MTPSQFWFTAILQRARGIILPHRTTQGCKSIGTVLCQSVSPWKRMRVVPADMLRYATWIFRLPMFLENISEALLAGTYIFLTDKLPFPQRRQFESEVPAAYQSSPRNGLAPHLQQRTAIFMQDTVHEIRWASFPYN
jgi:hypothetical protein